MADMESLSRWCNRIKYAGSKMRARWSRSALLSPAVHLKSRIRRVRAHVANCSSWIGLRSIEEGSEGPVLRNGVQGLPTESRGATRWYYYRACFRCIAHFGGSCALL